MTRSVAVAWDRAIKRHTAGAAAGSASWSRAARFAQRFESTSRRPGRLAGKRKCRPAIARHRVLARQKPTGTAKRGAAPVGSTHQLRLQMLKPGLVANALSMIRLPRCLARCRMALVVRAPAAKNHHKYSASYIQAPW